ncbi:MAG: hypothetical protein ACRDS1_17935 [Pseudonocardiaceae bacterium]
MPTTPANALGDDPAATTTPMPRVEDVALHLSSQTLAWLADHPQARKLVGSVMDTLTELEQAGHHPRPIAALRRVLTTHQPTPAGRCPTCRRATWRRRPFPCTVWHQIHGELLGVFTHSGRGQPRR